jgi:hypothetical protein
MRPLRYGHVHPQDGDRCMVPGVAYGRLAFRLQTTLFRIKQNHCVVTNNITCDQIFLISFLGSKMNLGLDGVLHLTYKITDDRGLV